MTSLKVYLTLTLMVVMSCHAFPQRMSPDTQQLLSQLLTSRFESSPHGPAKLPSQVDDDSSSDNFNDNNNDEDEDVVGQDYDSISGQRKQSKFNPGLLRNSIQDRYNFPLYPIQNGIGSEAMARLRVGLWALEKLGEGSAEEAPIRVPGFVAAGKWKRQPHLGFHGSRG